MTLSYYERARRVITLFTGETPSEVKIPKLGLTLQTSSEPLIQRKQTIENILHAGNTTIIPIRDISSTNFLGLSVLNANLGSEEHYVNPWQAEDVGEICQRLGKGGISGRMTREYLDNVDEMYDESGAKIVLTKRMEVPINMMLLNDAPPHLRPSLKRFMSDARIYAEAPIRDLHGRFTSLLPSISTNLVANGKYLVLRDEEGTTQVIQLKDDTGNYLLPRNWLRVPMSYWTTSSLPTDLRWYMDQLTADRTSQFKELRNDLVAVTNSSSVRLVKRADGNHTDLNIDHLGNVGSNVCVDPENSNRVYYCGGDYSSLEVVDLSETKPVQERRNLTKPYHNVHNIQIDPSGKFILISTEDERGHNSVQVLRKDTLEPVGVIPNLSDVSYDGNGLLHGVGSNGRLGTYTLNFDQIWASLQEGMRARLETARQTLVDEVTQQLEGAISFNQVLGVDKALQARLAGLGKQYNSADFHYLTQSVQDLINTRRSMLATQEIQMILNHRIETALKAPVSINVEISLSRYRAQLEARLHYLDAGKNAELIAQARTIIVAIEQRRARFVETQTSEISGQIGAEVKTIVGEINALTLESFTSFILAERINEIKALLAKMGIEYGGLVPLDRYLSTAQNELVSAYRARLATIQTEATSAVMTPPALAQPVDTVQFKQTLGRTLIDVFVWTLRTSRPGSLEDVKRLAGYNGLKQQLNDLYPKLSAELEERIEQYLGGVKIMESDIDLVDGQLTKIFCDDELKVDVRLPIHSAGEYPPEVRALISELDPNWVLDDWTLMQLGKIATAVVIQLKSNSGAIFLKGPPGVGKDVLIKIISAMLRRPLYTHQGGKSMDEETLYSDVSLVSDGMGTNSVVSHTPLHDGCLQSNSLVYIEEANAIKESGQIALHRLLEERIIPAGAQRDATPAAQGVTIIMSGNIGNGGTHPIEAALLSRLTVIDIEKPPFKKINDDYYPYEAMRGANITPTLSSLVRKGQFPSVWDYYVNGKGDQPGVALNTKQLFDLEAIFKILQIGNELWTHYLKINQGGKSQAEAMRTCPAILPFTRDFNICVGALSFYPQGGDATATARLLLKRFYAKKLDSLSQIKAVEEFIDKYPCSELKNN